MVCFPFEIGLGFEDEEDFELRSGEVGKRMKLRITSWAMVDVLADYEEQRSRGLSRGRLSSKHHHGHIFRVRCVASMSMCVNITHQQSIHKKKSPGNKKDKVGAMPRLYPQQGGGVRNHRAASESVSFTGIMREE